MAKNDVVLLDKVLEAGRSLAPSGLDDGSYFELFVAEQVLEAYDLSTDELLGGICGGGDDGGIDGLYVFADGRLIEEEGDLSSPREGIELSIVVFRAKATRGFGEKPIQLLAGTLAELLDLSLTGADLEQAGLYSSSLIAAAELVRYAITRSAGKRPQVSFAIAYATKGGRRRDLAGGVRARRPPGRPGHGGDLRRHRHRELPRRPRAAPALAAGSV